MVTPTGSYFVWLVLTKPTTNRKSDCGMLYMCIHVCLHILDTCVLVGGGGGGAGQLLVEL